VTKTTLSSINWKSPQAYIVVADMKIAGKKHFRQSNPVLTHITFFYSINTSIIQIPLPVVWTPSLTNCL